MATEQDYAPKVNDKDIYLVSGKTLKDIYAKIKSGRPKGDHTTTETTEETDGTTIKVIGGTGGGGLGPVVFNGAANGQPCFFLINSDGVAYDTAPSGYPIANPD